MYCHLVTKRQHELKLNASPDVLRDAAEPALAVNSLWEKNSFSDGADVKGTLILFFWLKIGTGRQPDGDTAEENKSRHTYQTRQKKNH